MHLPQSLRLRLLPLFLLVTVALVPVAQHGWKLHRASAAGQAAAYNSATRQSALGYVGGIPNRIVVPSAGIDISIVEGKLAPNGLWTVATAQANYADSTVPINNQKGQTLIYGHATTQVFGPLLNLKKGAQAFVYTSNNHIFTYRFTGANDVLPNNTAVLDKAKQGSGLVLMTCDGDQYQFRRLLEFTLVRVV